MKNDYSEIMMSFPKCDFTEVNNQSPSSMFNHRVRFCDLDIDDLFCYADRLMIKVGTYTAHTAGKREIDSFMFNPNDIVKIIEEISIEQKDVSPSNTNPMPFIDEELIHSTFNFNSLIGYQALYSNITIKQKDVTRLLLYIKDSILTVNFDNDNFIQYTITVADDWVEVLPPLSISGQLVSDLFIQQKDGVFGVYRHNFNHNHNILVEKSMSGDNWRQGDTVTIIFNSFISF